MDSVVIELRLARLGFLVAGALATGAAIAGCGGGTTDASTVTQTAIRETVTVNASPAVTTEEPGPATASPSATVIFTMPKLVGDNLQLGQDKLQSLGSYLLDQEDASGLGRIQVNDSNWTICSQSPKAGAKVPVETVVLLSSVKLSEDCP